MLGASDGDDGCESEQPARQAKNNTMAQLTIRMFTFAR